MTEPMTLTAYAERRGVSTKAVSKAVASGRLAKSVVRDKHGAPKIADPELADREWTAKTRSSINRPSEAPANEETDPAPPRPATAAPAPRSPSDVPDYHDSRARREAQAARREAALADMAELEVAERRGELISVEQARADVLARFTMVRTRILGVPSRIAQRLPHLAAEVVPVLDEALREALEELAVDEGRGGGGEGEGEDS